MKRLLSVVFAICAPVVLALTLAAQAAMAYCATGIEAMDADHNIVACHLTGEDANWCYYDCDCSGDCTSLYDQLGLIDP